ncbi:hypothetical protein C8Q75DRAFT_765969 [Abortiporus biennis]|nr:hypothetical protein C8Q75DRAFT_765969 [Abortiporus biennis]
MSSRRDHSRDSRSRSPDTRRRHRSDSKDRSRSPERRITLPYNASPISDSDYFLKSEEFRVWLKDEKRKYMDELSSEKSRKYFRKFVKAWNRGKLSKTLYSGVDSQPASSNTGYKWSFASKASKADSNALQAARDEVGAATYNRSTGSYDRTGPSTSAGGGIGRFQGPTLPSQSDLTLAREAMEEERRAERDYKRKRDKRDEKDRIEEMVGPKPVGREGMLEKKRAKRENDKAFREKGDDGYEADESTLMGGGDSFKDHIARRDAARKRYEEKKMGGKDNRFSDTRERADAIRQKDRATMDMFMQIAKEKFG